MASSLSTRTLGSSVLAYASHALLVGGGLVLACVAHAETLAPDVQAAPPPSWTRDNAPIDRLGKTYGKLLAAYRIDDDCYLQLRRTACQSKDECGEMAFTKSGLWSNANEQLGQCCETDECRAPSPNASKPTAKYKCEEGEDVQPPTETLARVRQHREDGAFTVELGEFFETLPKDRYATLVVAAACSKAAYQKHAAEIDTFMKSITFGHKRSK